MTMEPPGRSQGLSEKIWRGFHDLKIRQKLIAGFVFGAIPLAVLVSFVLDNQVKRTIEAHILSELNNATSAITSLVRTAADVSVQNWLRATAEKNREIAAHFLGRHQQGQLSRAEAVQRIRDVFLSQTIGKTGYIYCIDSRGIAVLHPHDGVEGVDHSHYPFVQHQLRDKEGYLEYDWKNPGELEARPKALYMVYFEPLDWIISVTAYREEFDALIDVAVFQEGVLSLRFGPSGYPFVIDLAGNGIIHPKLAGTSIAALEGFPADFLPTAKVQSHGTFRYRWRNPGEESAREKLMVYHHLEELGWIVASSAYLDEIFQPLYQVRRLVLAALAAATLLGLLIAFFVGARITRPLDVLMTRFAAGAEGDFSVRMHLTRRDEIGELARYFNLFMQRLADYSVSLNTEIAQRMRAATALEKSEAEYRGLYAEAKSNEALYRSILNTSPDAVVFFDRDGRVRFLSPSFTALFGWTFDELKGREIPFVPDDADEAAERLLRDVAAGGIPRSGIETRRTTKDQGILDVSISAARYHDHTGEPAGLLTILRDISKTRQLEAQVRQAQRMESVGRLAGGIAHDFNNLLMGIQGISSIMMAELDPGHPHRERLSSINRHVASAAKLTGQLLGFARGGKYQPKPTDLNRVLLNTVNLFAQTRKDLVLHRHLDPSLWTVVVDRTQFEQVFMNLLVNAAQAMPGGGDIFLKSENRMLPEAAAAALGLVSGRYVAITIQDTGEGIEAEIRNKIFDPFFSTRPRGRGTGLGLSSVYGIVTNHGGVVTVESTPGQGAAFRIHLPASDQAVETSQIAAKRYITGSGTVLLVDDEAFILEIGSRFLEKIGYTALTADSGAAALEVLQHRNGRVSLVILDLVMPGMTGDETFDRIKRIHRDIRVLLSSGYSIDGQAAAILARGADGFIQKPFTLEQLSCKIAELLRE